MNKEFEQIFESVKKDVRNVIDELGLSGEKITPEMLVALCVYVQRKDNVLKHITLPKDNVLKHITLPKDNVLKHITLPDGEKWHPEFGYALRELDYGDVYYYFGFNSKIDKQIWLCDSFDKNLFMIWEIFKTREHAEQALERVKKALKGEKL